MWRHVISAMDSIAALDSDGDGLPDTDTKRNKSFMQRLLS